MKLNIIYFSTPYLSGYACALSEHMCVTSFRLTFENTSLWFDENITVGRSEHANIFVVDRDLQGEVF